MRIIWSFGVGFSVWLDDRLANNKTHKISPNSLLFQDGNTFDFTDSFVMAQFRDTFIFFPFFYAKKSKQQKKAKHRVLSELKKHSDL